MHVYYHVAAFAQQKNYINIYLQFFVFSYCVSQKSLIKENKTVSNSKKLAILSNIWLHTYLHSDFYKIGNRTVHTCGTKFIKYSEEIIKYRYKLVVLFLFTYIKIIVRDIFMII